MPNSSPKRATNPSCSTKNPLRSRPKTARFPASSIFKRAWQDAPFVDLHPSALPLLTQAPAVQGNTLGNQTGLVISGVSDRNQQTWALDGVAQDTTTQTGNPAFFETVEVAIANPGVDAAKPVQVR
jgi:hypothetical protein